MFILLLTVGVLVALIIYRLVTSAGDMGEHAVARRLRWLDRGQYFIINDLMLAKNNGNTTQIDHVVVSPYGIFVIETKNISGYIYGSEYSKQWERHWRGYMRGGYYGHDDRTFDNPIMQNDAHIKALAETINMADYKFISIIAFSDKADLRTSVDSAYVVYWSQIRNFIRQFKEPLMTVEEAEKVYRRLLALNIKDKDTRKQHPARARLNKNNYETSLRESIEMGRCPRCGERLVRRSSKHGPFYGCTNYPACTYTHPIN